MYVIDQDKHKTPVILETYFTFGPIWDPCSLQKRLGLLLNLALTLGLFWAFGIDITEPNIKRAGDRLLR